MLEVAISGSHLRVADPEACIVVVRGQLERLIATGSVAAGTRLPTVRQLASDLSPRNRAISDAARRFHAEVLRAGGTVDDAIQALRSISG